MKKQLITTTLILIFSTLAMGQTTEVLSILKSGIKYDLAGEKNTTFKGEIYKFKNEMIEEYGGRFNPDQEPTLELIETSSSVYRSEQKYCDTWYDKNMKKTEDTNKMAYRECQSFLNANYILIVKFNASTSGTFEVESREFQVSEEYKYLGLFDNQGEDVTNEIKSKFKDYKLITMQGKIRVTQSN